MTAALSVQPSFLELGAELAGGLWRHDDLNDDAAFSRRASIFRHPTGKPDNIFVDVNFHSCDVNTFNNIRFIGISGHVWGDLLRVFRSVRGPCVMSNHRRWLNKPQYFDDIAAEDYVHEQIRFKRIHNALKLSAAISSLAGEIGASPWTIANIYRGRIKALRGKLRDAILQHKITFLHRQIEAMGRELEAATRLGIPLRQADHEAIMAEVEAARALIAEIRRGRPEEEGADAALYKKLGGK